MLKIIKAKEIFTGAKLKRFVKRKEETKEINRLQKIFKTEEQIEELSSIYYYISIVLKEQNIAEKLLTKIRTEVLSLSYFPKANRVIYSK